MSRFPTGTVTLLFTDIEGSTRLLEEHGERYATLLADHRRALRDAFAAQDGVEVDTQGDAFFYAFASAAGAVAAASNAQAALSAGPVRVRMGMHTGAPTATEEGYVGIDVHRAARICSAGHGGQIVVSNSTRELLHDGKLRDLGEHRLKDLSEPVRLYQVGDGEFPRLRTLHQTNLPVPATPFLGRGRELGEVMSLLLTSRLLTLTGPGGTGKTRLAAQAAAESAEAFPGGVWWVSLAAVRDPALVLDSIAHVLEASGDLAEHLGDKELLLLLDNLEQLLDAAPDLADLLARCSGLRIVVTSREPLRVGAEQEYQVQPFVSEEAVGFFNARARVVDPSFAPTEVVGAICARLDNLPLALELAAARVKVLSLEQILTRLERSLHLLTGGARDAPERQRTLAGAISWSYDLLAEEEKRLFTRLSVFAGGCTLDGAEAIGAELDTLASLVDKSLVRHSGDRFWMLATIREFASEQLWARGEHIEIHRLHATYFSDMARRASAELRGSHAAQWLSAVEAELDNIRAALTFAIKDSEFDAALQLSSELYRFWLAHGRATEGRRWLEEFLASSQSAPAEVRGTALMRAGDMALWQGDYERAAELGTEAAPLLRDAGLPAKLSSALTTIGWAVGALGDRERARAVLEEALELGREEHLDTEIASALNSLAALYKGEGDYETALRLNEECLDTIERVGDPLNVAIVLGNVGESALGVGALDRATEALERSLTLARELGDSRQAEWALAHLAFASLLKGDAERSEALFAESLPHAFEARDRRALDVCFHGLAGLAAAAGEPERAARLWGAAESLRESLGDEPSPYYGSLQDAYLQEIRAALGDRYDPLVAEGHALALEEAVDLAGLDGHR
jgi:predicted ATPase/class 3 adenylate cyclase